MLGMFAIGIPTISCMLLIISSLIYTNNVFIRYKKIKSKLTLLPVIFGLSFFLAGISEFIAINAPSILIAIIMGSISYFSIIAGLVILLLYLEFARTSRINREFIAVAIILATINVVSLCLQGISYIGEPGNYQRLFEFNLVALVSYILLFLCLIYEMLQVVSRSIEFKWLLFFAVFIFISVSLILVELAVPLIFYKLIRSLKWEILYINLGILGFTLLFWSLSILKMPVTLLILPNEIYGALLLTKSGFEISKVLAEKEHEEVVSYTSTLVSGILAVNREISERAVSDSFMTYNAVGRDVLIYFGNFIVLVLLIKFDNMITRDIAKSMLLYLERSTEMPTDDVISEELRENGEKALVEIIGMLRT